MSTNRVQKKRTSTYTCPCRKQTDHVYETPHELRPRDKPIDNLSSNGTSVGIYHNINHDTRALTDTSPCEETIEHVYESCRDIRPRESRRSQTAWLAVSISLCLGVVGFTVYDIFFVSIPPCQCHTASVNNNDGKDTLFCVECSHLAIQIIKQKESCLILLAITSEDGVYKCCAGNATQLKALLTLCVSQSEETPVNRARTSANVIRSTPVSAQMRLLQPPDVEEAGQGPFYSSTSIRTLRLDPNNTNPLLKHARGVRVEAVGMVVQFPGLYYIYSSIHYKPLASYASHDCQNEIWLHYVFRMSPNIPENMGLLLHTIQSACGMCRENSATAFTGGVFNLKEDDYIQVEASKPNMVNYDSGSTYLGLIMLASDGK